MTVAAANAPAVRRKIRVRATPERAFDMFTGNLARWWPIETNSLDAENTEAVVLEPHVGGRLFQRQKNGETHDWAVVLAFDPPGRLELAWHVGRERSFASRVEIVFSDAGEGMTEVSLVHDGFEAMDPDKPRETRDHYDSGWVNVFERRFADALGGATA